MFYFTLKCIFYVFFIVIFPLECAQCIVLNLFYFYNGTGDAPEECAVDFTLRLFKIEKCYWYIPRETVVLTLAPILFITPFSGSFFYQTWICIPFGFFYFWNVSPVLNFLHMIFPSEYRFSCYRKMDTVICNYRIFHNCYFTFSFMHPSDQKNEDFYLICSLNEIVICPSRKQQHPHFWHNLMYVIFTNRNIEVHTKIIQI